MAGGSGVKVSVIVPVYNAEKNIRQCIDSILCQSLREIEVICVDDGSADNSYEILQEYQRADDRISAIRQRNQFAGVARNNGMKRARGEYLCFLDSDDFFDGTFLEKMYGAAREQGSDVAICAWRCLYVLTGGVQPGARNMEEKFLPVQHDRFNRKDAAGGLFQITNGWAWDKIFRREYVMEKGLAFSGSRTANDGYFVYAAMALAECITKIDESLVTHRMGDMGSLSNTREKSWRCGFQMLYDIEGRLKKEGLYEELEQSFLNRALDYMMWSLESMDLEEIREKVSHTIAQEAEKRWQISRKRQDFFYDETRYQEYCYLLSHGFQAYERKYGIRFPFEKIARGSKVVLYGAGGNGKKYYQQLHCSQYAKVVFWLDQKYAPQAYTRSLTEGGKREGGGGRLYGWVDDLEQIEYDYILITPGSEAVVKEIKDTLLGCGVPEGKIIAGRTEKEEDSIGHEAAVIEMDRIDSEGGV